jgi:hypothetical protein
MAGSGGGGFGAASSSRAAAPGPAASAAAFAAAASELSLHATVRDDSTGLGTSLLLSGCGVHGVDARDGTGGTSLHVATETNNIAAARVLLFHKASLEAKHALDGGTPLLHAAYAGSIDVVRLLIGAGASLMAESAVGAGVMHFAAFAESEELAALLLAAGAPPTRPAPWAHANVSLLAFAATFVRLAAAVIRVPGSPPPPFASHERWTYTVAAAATAARAGGCSEPVSVHAFQLTPAAATPLNAALLDEAAVLVREGPGIDVSNHGGFHSSRALFASRSRAAPCVATLALAVRAALDAVGAAPGAVGQSWLNLSRPTHYNKLHDHAPAAWSGAYYAAVAPTTTSAAAAAAGDESMDGHFAMRFAAEECGANAAAPTGVCHFASIAPEAGLLLLFPASLKHCVCPFPRSASGEEGTRISISFNA